MVSLQSYSTIAPHAIVYDRARSWKKPDLGNMGKRVLGGTLRFTFQAIHCCASQYSSK